MRLEIFQINPIRVFAFGAVYALAVDQLLWNLIARGLAARGSATVMLIEIALAAIGTTLMVRIAGDHAGNGRRDRTAQAPQLLFPRDPCRANV